MVSQLVDHVVHKKFENMLVMILTLIAVLVVSSGIIIFWKSFSEKKTEEEKQKLKYVYYDLIIGQDLSVLNSMDFGEEKEKLNDDYEFVTDYFLWKRPNLLVSCIAVILYSVILFKINWIVLVTLSLISLIQVISPVIITKFTKVNYENMREVEARLTNFIVFSYSGLDVLKSYNLNSWYIQKLKLLHKEYSKAGVAAEVVCTSEIIMDNFVDNLLTYGCYVILGLYVMMGWMNIEQVAQILVITSSFFASYKAIFGIITECGIKGVATKRLNQYGFRKNSDAEEKNFKDECFAVKDFKICGEDERVLLDVEQCRIDLSKKNVLIGANGSGKTSLLKHLLRERVAESGDISFGSISVKDISDNVLYNKLFYVSQDDVLLSISPQELVQEIAKENKEKVSELALKFGMTKEMLESDRIDELSMGNRRKLYLAIAFSLENKHLILDEPSNYLDKRGFDVLKEQLNDYKYGYLMITHSKDLIETADNKFEIRDGVIL